VALHERADTAAVITCFTVPGLVAGTLAAAVSHGEGPGVWLAAAKGAFVGAGSATALGGLLAIALRSGIEGSA